MGLQLNPAQAQSARRLSFPIRLILSLAAGLLVGAGVAAAGPGMFLPGWLAAGLLAWISIYGLLLAWEWGGAGRSLAWMMALAFGLRLGLGILISLALPVWGYQHEPVEQAGYLFKDAYARDLQAWQLAASGDPLWVAFGQELYTDQYGGLLAVSASIYRYLSPDMHRPLLPLILGALVATLGVPFLRQAVRLRWPGRVAVIATWIYVLYPDAIFFGIAQMREPFLVGLSAAAFWAVLALDPARPGQPTRASSPAVSSPFSAGSRATWLVLALSLAGMLLFSSRVTAAVAGLLGLLFLLEYVIPNPNKTWKVLGWVGLVLGTLFVLAFSWEWFRSSTAWDVIVSVGASGSLTKRVEEVSQQLHLPENMAGVLVSVVYGLARPVLPAAIADSSSIPFWKTVGILRSAGWYALAPFLLYALFTVWKEPDARQRRLMIWLALAVSLWLVVASARGGGDGTDNPRYRSLFIIWLALLAAWALDRALTLRDAWLWRWLTVEVIFLAFFMYWYLSRYYRLWAQPPFWQVVAWVVGLSLLVLGGGWARDRWKARLG